MSTTPNLKQSPWQELRISVRETPTVITRNYKNKPSSNGRKSHNHDVDTKPNAPLALEVEPGTAVPVLLEDPDPVPEGMSPARMIEAAFSASAYVGAMSYDTKN